MTRSDTLHPLLYVECKSISRSLLYSLWDRVVERAKAEHKTPVMAYHRPGAKGNLAIIDWELFTQLWTNQFPNDPGPELHPGHRGDI